MDYIRRILYHLLDATVTMRAMTYLHEALLQHPLFKEIYVRRFVGNFCCSLLAQDSRRKEVMLMKDVGAASN